MVAGADVTDYAARSLTVVAPGVSATISHRSGDRESFSVPIRNCQLIFWGGLAGLRADACVCCGEEAGTGRNAQSRTRLSSAAARTANGQARLPPTMRGKSHHPCGMCRISTSSDSLTRSMIMSFPIVRLRRPGRTSFRARPRRGWVDNRYRNHLIVGMCANPVLIFARCSS